MPIDHKAHPSISKHPMKSPIWPMLVASLLASGAAAQESPLSACRRIATTAERLTCYDAIPLTAVAPPPAAARVEPPKIIETGIAGAFNGWWPKEKITMTNGQVWQIIDGSTGAMKLTDPRVTIRRDLIGGYHLEIEGANVYPRVKQVPLEADLAAAAAEQATADATNDSSVIETSIAGPFNGWWPKDKIALTNGQVWQISDDSTGTASVRDPKVRIRRSFFGGYRLEIDGVAKSPSVKRVQ